MALKNKSMYAILGILDITPSSGYEIKKYSDMVLSGFWNENFGHIYPTLKKMLEDGTIEIKDGETNEKKVQYKITAKGKKELNTWLLEDTMQPPVRSEFMLKLFFSSSLPSEKVIKAIQSYKELHKKKIDTYHQFLAKLEQDNSEISSERVGYYKAVLRKGVLTSQATIQWCDETIEDLNNSRRMRGHEIEVL